MAAKRILSLLSVSLAALSLYGQQPASIQTGNTETLDQLRAQMAQQEEQLNHLQHALDQERALLEKASGNPAANRNSEASTAKLVPVVNVVHPITAPDGAGQNLQSANPSPLSIHIGNTTFSPLGFVDFTYFGRSTNVGSGIGTSFGGLPYNNSYTGHIAENNFSTQNSRIGFRVDSDFLGAKVLGYFEADFLGNQAASVFVTSNADTFRMRNVFVDVQKHGLEILGGQDWSLFTPNRKGLSPLPSDIFYTQNMDTNYQAGLVWARQSQFRLIAHPNDDLAFGISLENPQQFVAGAGVVAFPAAFATAAGTQFNNTSTNYTAPNVHPDIILKAAYDGHVGDKIMHVESGALIRSFKDSFGFGTSPTVYKSSTTTAVSGEVDANLQLVKNFHLIANTFFGSGGGRYIFGLGPDVIVRADGSLSPVHTYSTVDGFEVNVAKNTLLDAYYGGAYFGRNVSIDTNGSPIGYGYFKSPTSDNRAIEEATFGLTQTFWKNPNYGALSLITQYSYVWRDPWYVAPGGAKNARTNMYYVDLRYTLP